MSERDITVSVVSHRQNALVNQLLSDIAGRAGERVSLLVTENVPDSVPLAAAHPEFPMEIVVNAKPKGFGANHNAAFLRCNAPFFCVVNPDVRLPSDPFPLLIGTLREKRAAVVGPLVRSPAGSIEDSARRFPSAWALAKKLFSPPAGPDYPAEGESVEADWLAGMFMLFSAEAFRRVGGFDERYFLYYEDADICRRIRSAGDRVRYEPRAEIVHDARRGSRRNPRLAAHHVASIIRFLAQR
jgi:N-acetylglucosaminyl-diphospho-decaprenol L-rhamnosyltransferase